jgi:predicted amidohydrolase
VSSLALAAVQLELTIDDLASPEAFERCIASAAADAAAASVGADHSLLVFPEDTGHFATLAFAPAAARRKATVDEAIAAYAVRRPLTVLRGLLGNRGADVSTAVLSAMLPDADRLMNDVFSAVARRHGATVVAGSHLRPAAPGTITNSSFTFTPDGQLAAITDKVNLVPGMEDSTGDGLGLAHGDPDRVPVVDVGWGKLATLICYDGFCEPHTRSERFVALGPQLDAAGVDVIANPAANPWEWDAPWIFAEPGENIARGQQWRSEGLTATLAGLSHVRFGVTAHLVARVLDQAFEGESEVLERTPDGARALATATSRDRGEVVVAVVTI